MTVSQQQSNKNGAGFQIKAKTPACKIIARFKKTTKRKTAGNTFPLSRKANAVIANISPDYTPVFFRERNSIAVRGRVR